MKPDEETWWDDLACNICNWALRKLATNPAAVFCRVRVDLLDWMRYDGGNNENKNERSNTHEL